MAALTCMAAHVRESCVDGNVLCEAGILFHEML